jgi:hypothetical protein
MNPKKYLIISQLGEKGAVEDRGKRKRTLE